MTLCNAGHPARWSTDASTARGPRSKRVADETGPSNLPLGVLESSLYHAREFTLQPGDLVLAYTDGLIEARNGRSEQLGLDGLLEVLETLGDPHVSAGPGELAHRLRSAVEQRGFALDEDDLSAVGLECTGRSAGVRWAQRLEGLGKLYRDWRAGRPIPRPEISIPAVGGAFISALNRIRPRRR
jgi:serine phosphatase RsbU (regulator of sigma subunit)